MAKPKAGTRVRPEMVADYELSRFQDQLRETVEAMETLLLLLNDLEQRLGVIKGSLGMPVEALSQRDESEFYQ